MHLDLQHHLSLHQRFSTPTNRHCVTKAGRFHIDSATSKRLSSPVAGFGASHRALHKNDLAKLNVEYHRLMRMVVGLPAGTVLSDYVGLRPWFVTCIEAAWTLASYVATLLSERWTRTTMAWNIRGGRQRTRPAYTWETALETYCLRKGFDNWIVEFAAYAHWMRVKKSFVVFTL